MTNCYAYLLLHYQNQKRRNAQLILIALEMLKSTDKKKQKKHVHSRNKKLHYNSLTLI